MSARSTEAEKALERKYALLRAKKAQAAKAESQRKQAAHEETPQPDAARLKAIAALKAKRAAQSGGAGPSAPPPPTEKKEGKPSTTIKLKIAAPKKENPSPPVAPAPPAAAAAATAPSTADKAQPEAKAPSPSDAKPSGGSEAQKQPEQRKRPTLKRPPVRRSGAQGEEPDAKRAQQHAAGGEPSYEQPSAPVLYVGDIPSYLTADQLYEYFSEFQDPSRDEDPIIDTQVLPGLCSGFVTFATFEDALDVLKFVEQQPLALEDRELRISWATEQDIEQLQAHFGAHDEGGDGAGSYLEGVPVDVDPHGVHPKAMDARAMAAKVAEQRVQHDLGAAPLDAPAAAGRDVVSYDDL